MVEVDENYMCRRKFHGGRVIKQFWVVGGKERGSNKRFAVSLDGKSRNATNLISIIKDNVLPGGVVVTDCHRGYNNLASHGYTHDTINYSQNFVRLGNIHTQSVERMWGT